MDTTNLQNGTSGKTMLLDFVDEVQVKSSGYNAEFGGATGGVVSVLTKSGTNRYQGQIGTYYQTDNFYGDRRPFVRFNPFDSNVAETGLLNPDDKWELRQPAWRHRRPDPKGSAVVLRRCRVHQERHGA